jgi:hypothetical protein
MAYDKSVPFSFNKNGIYYFERRVSRDLRKHYSAAKIAYSLRTRSASVAASSEARAAQQLDEYWYHLRVKETELPGRHLPGMQRRPPDALGFALSPFAQGQCIFQPLRSRGDPAQAQRR